MSKRKSKRKVNKPSRGRTRVKLHELDPDEILRREFDGMSPEEAIADANLRLLGLVGGR